MIDRIIAIVGLARPGHTWKTDTSFPPIISMQQFDRIEGIVQRAIGNGADVLTGGGRVASMDAGAFFEPTILSRVSSDMEVVREEIFGPVLTVQNFDEEEEGLQLADHPSFGFAAGVYTKDVNKALRAVRKIKAGTVWVNRYGRSSDYIIPTGGYKDSGIGKDLGRQAVEANMRFKSVLVDFSR